MQRRNGLSKLAAVVACIAGLGLVGNAAADADNNSLNIEGETIATDVAGPADGPLEHLYSGWRFRTPETQVLQSDDFENPGFVGVDEGEALWSAADGGAGKSCADCHNDASESMKGVRAEMPKWNAEIGKPHTLESQINFCRTERMEADTWKWDSSQMLGMTSYVGLQSRGMPVAIQTDGDMSPWIEQGKEIYYKRVGQLDMACANCHETNFGNMIRADHLSQGHTNGFPVYRLKWGGLGSIHRRFKGCMQNIRATPYKKGSDEFIALEAYVASRGKGLSVETPSVRN